MNFLIEKLERKLLPEFEKVAQKINQKIPNILARAYSSPVGSNTEFQGHSFYIDCIFTEDILGESDNVCLGVELCHITTIPKISADVCWGHPNAHIEAEFYNWYGSFAESGRIVSDEVLEDLYKNLPRLYEALFNALIRRKTSNE